MENYQFDEKLMNQGWSQMHDLLDREMPVQKKRRVPFGWWWSAASLAMAAALLLFFNAPNFDKKNTQNTIVQQNETQIKEEQISQIGTPEEHIVSHENNFFKEKNIDKNKKNESVQSDFFIKKENQKNTYNIDNQIIVNKNEDNISLNTVEKNFNTTGSISQEKQNAETKRLIELKEKIEIASLSLLEKNVQAISVNESEKNIFLEKKIKKINYLRANNLKIGIFASATQGVNFGISLKKTWQKHSLSANLIWEASLKNLDIYRSTVPVIGPDSMPTFPVVFPYGENNLAKDNSDSYKTNLDSDYYFSLSTQSVGLCIEHNYRFKKRWESILGFEYLREAGKRGYKFAQVQDKYSLIKSKNNNPTQQPEINTLGAGNINTVQINDFDMAFQSQYDLKNININKNVFYFTTGFSYYFGKNLKFSAIYKQRLNAVMATKPINVLVTGNNIALRLTYYLPLKNKF